MEGELRTWAPRKKVCSGAHVSLQSLSAPPYPGPSQPPDQEKERPRSEAGLCPGEQKQHQASSLTWETRLLQLPSPAQPS
jgi:hypothetical protein